MIFGTGFGGSVSSFSARLEGRFQEGDRVQIDVQNGEVALGKVEEPALA